MLLQVSHLCLPDNKELIPIAGVRPIDQPRRSNARLKEALPPWLRDGLLQNDVDSGVVMLHRDTIPNPVELKCLLSMRGVFSLLKVKIIKGG